MNASFPHRFARMRDVATLLCAAWVSHAAAQTPVPPPPTVAPSAVVPSALRSEVPDGAPQLPAEKVVTNASVTATGKSSTSVIVEEERVQGRLASAHVSVGGAKGYSVVDPTVGRIDRSADNGGKRVRPSMWELLRF
jgi:hypothetical protein